MKKKNETIQKVGGIQIRSLIFRMKVPGQACLSRGVNIPGILDDIPALRSPVTI